MSVNPYPATNTGGPDGPNVIGGRPWTRWQDWCNLVLGVWLFIAPWIWHSTTVSTAGYTNSGWNAWILGVIIVVMALWALAQPRITAPEWINAIAGIWLFIAPWCLGFSRAGASSAWNQWVVGIIVFVLAIWAANSLGGTRRTGARTV